MFPQNFDTVDLRQQKFSDNLQNKAFQSKSGGISCKLTFNINERAKFNKTDGLMHVVIFIPKTIMNSEN